MGTISCSFTTELVDDVFGCYTVISWWQLVDFYGIVCITFIEGEKEIGVLILGVSGRLSIWLGGREGGEVVNGKEWKGKKQMNDYEK